MAQHTIGKTSVQSNSATYTSSLRTVLLLRLTFGLAITLGSIISFLSLSWDIQWHALLGRDRTLTPPHLFMLSAIALCGVAALAAVLTETLWMKRNQAMAKQFTPFAKLFAAPLGAYIAGYAALNSAVAFPLDQYWHTLYGIDVTIWAPFHIMVISGLALTGFGAAYTLASVARLATRLHAITLMRVAYVGLVLAMAATLCEFMILVFSGIDPDNFINVGFTSFSLFPLLSSLLIGGIFVTMAYAVPWKWAATSIAGIAALFLIIDQLIVPPAITWLMQIEQLTYRNGSGQPSIPPQVSLVTLSWPLLCFVSAILIDVFVQLARKYNWSKQRLTIAIAVAVFIGCFPLSLRKPLATPDIIMSLNFLGMLLTLATTALGIFIGTKLGQSIGKTMSTSER